MDLKIKHSISLQPRQVLRKLLSFLYQKPPPLQAQGAAGMLESFPARPQKTTHEKF
ncbi:MAG: hypothetical protein Q7T98_04665 [Polaromonas sp.]|nr:hypothetical protein [Polaromonas sp.]MDO9259181.1 hypothetical protein [Polaromonas sp.]